MSKEVLGLNNISVRFKEKDLVVIKSVSFSVAKSEIVAILGPSGCGKTTLLNLISGLLSSKEAEIKGTIRQKNKTKIATVFQEPRLLPWRNLVENISFGLETQGTNLAVAQKRALRVLETVDLADYAEYYPSDISFGMQQRINFARAISCEPDILLLDEPFSALDVKTRKKIEKNFLEVIKLKEITTLFVTHNIEEAILLADRIIVLSKKPTTVSKIVKRSDFGSILNEHRSLYK